MRSAWTWGFTTPDIIRYYMGEYSQIFGRGLIVEAGASQARPYRSSTNLLSGNAPRTYPESVEATGEDSVIALYTMASGAIVQLSYVGGGRGSQGWNGVSMVAGELCMPPENATAIQSCCVWEGRELKGKEILSLLPQFELNEITERFFGKGGVEYEPPADAASAAFAVGRQTSSH